jgi:hypothetical protein
MQVQVFRQLPQRCEVRLSRHFQAARSSCSCQYSLFFPSLPRSVAELVSQPDDSYQPPRPPPEVAALYPDELALEHVRPGTPAAAKLFLLDLDAWTFVNHGAFGAAFSCGVRVAEAWRRVCEQQPLKFFDRCPTQHFPAFN